MNTVELLFKNAQDVLDDEIFVPVVLSKLAERGYTPENDEETIELLKHACVMRDALRDGQVALVPQSALEVDGSLSKQASDALTEDPFAFADDFTADLEKFSADVQDAAAIGLCGFKMGQIAMEKESSKAGLISKAVGATKKYVAQTAKDVGKSVSKAAKGGGKVLENAADSAGTAIKKGAKDAKKAVVKGAKGAAKEVKKQVKKPGVAAGVAGAAGVAAGGAGGYAAGKASKDKK